ncbi:MAG: methyltransferase domain-containing protein [Methanobacteriota archaeon]|nr:MAG: methyltransferase domain-containing protein [Euryarchaeota archaeon]
MASDARIEIIHFADPMCWWSWGLEPVLQRLKEVYGDNVNVTYRMGGTFRELHEWMKEYEVDEQSTLHWIHESVEMTRMPVQPDYLWQAKVSSTYPSCLAFKAAQRQSETKADRYFRRMMEAFQVECLPATDDTYVALAKEVGLDGERLRKDMKSKEVQTAFEEDMHAMHAAHANFLSLIVRNAEGKGVMKGNTFSAGPFEEIVDRLAPGLPKRIPSDMLEYMEHHKGITPAHEIAEVFQISEEDAQRRLDRLAAAGLLRAERFGETAFWRWGASKVDRLPMDLVAVSHVTPDLKLKGTADLAPIISRAVLALYTEVANNPDKSYHFPLGMEALTYVGYPAADLAKLPATATESFAGVGFPHAANAIRPGDTVLDIGSGSGTDVLYAALKAGAKGKIIGLDITPAMIAKARGNITAMGARNVEIREGNATKIPLPDASVDVVTSNGVLNLVVDKPAAFAEIHRVLKPGGRLQLADIVVEEDVGAVCGINPQLWADCIGGAAVEADYLKTIEGAGFRDVRVVRRLDYFAKSSSESTKRITKTFGAESVVVSAVKP